MIEDHLEVPRTARFYTLGDPGNASEVWIACHGYAQLARFFVRPFEGIVSAERAIIAPEALNRYYFESAPGVHGADARVAATWMTRDHREAEIADYVRYLDALAARVLDANPRARLTAFGFSQGAQTVSRWAALGSTRLHRLVLWGAFPAHDVQLTPETFHGARVLIATGDEDAYMVKQLAGEEARLSGVLPCEHFRYRGGHTVTEEALRELIAFV